MMIILWGGNGEEENNDVNDIYDHNDNYDHANEKEDNDN